MMKVVRASRELDEGEPGSVDLAMKGILSFTGMSIGGWVGWWLGTLISTFVAFLLAMVGTGVGLYLTNRFLMRYLP